MRSGLDYPSIPICPISNEQISIPATTPCGHTFEKKCINEWIAKKAKEKLPCLCPQCNKIIAVPSLETNYEMKSLFEQILSMINQISQLEKKLKIQHQKVQQLSFDEKKSDSILQGKIPVEQEILTIQSKKNARHLADAVVKQAGLVITQFFIGNYIKKHAYQVTQSFNEYTQKKKAILHTHTGNQQPLIASLLQCSQNISTHNMLHAPEQKQDPLRLCNQVQRFKHKIARDIEKARAEIEGLRDKYQGTVFFRIGNLNKYLRHWIFLDKKIQQLAEHLKDLREIEKQSRAESLSYSEETQQNTLTLFGGNRLKSATPTKNVEFFNAVQSEAIHAVRNLLAHYHFNLDMRDENGFTPLYITILKKDDAMMDLLIANKADLNAMIDWKDIKVPLIIMVILTNTLNDQEKQTSIRKLLLAGANVNARTSGHQDTALHWAANRMSENIIQLLLEFNADPSLQNNQEETPLMTAKIKQHKRCISLLNQAELQVRSKPHDKSAKHNFCF